MKNHISSLFRLAIVSLAAFPALASAAPAADTPYYNDVTNSYVQDQTSQVMGQLNNILCFMGAMAPDQMVNAGNYIALVDKNTCDSKGSGGQSNNTGAAYVSSVVNSTRVSTAADMQVKAWLAFTEQGMTKEIKVYATASQAPSATLPYGVFRMDFCGDVANCANDKGYINATTSGLSFYSSGTYGTDSETTALQLNAPSTSAGSGATSFNFSWNNGTDVGSANFNFAYNTGFFVRNDGSGDLCFDRSPANADESVWRYGLYDAAGARVSRNSGFPIEYTDTSVTPNVTANGYISYYGLWTQGAGPLSGATVNKVTYSNSGATKTPYTLLRTGGKLMKYTTANKTLADLHKVTFWYYAQQNIGTTIITASSLTTPATQYELYWDNTIKQFMVSGKQGSSGSMEPLTPTAIPNADMLTAHQWGLWGWSQMMGGQFGIKGDDFAALMTPTGAIPTPSDIPVKTQTQDVVYPTDYATALPNGLTCINDCPTVASIAASTYINLGWNQVASTAFQIYTLDAASGNLVDSVSPTSYVVSTATTGNLANGVRSGRMVTPADAAIIVTRKNALCGTCDLFSQVDVDLLDIGSSYYVWETGANPWNQIAILKDQTGAPVLFEAPLQVSFVVPTTAKYGSYQGATISLQYGGFGDLWGIPNECVDLKTNLACNFAQPALYQKQNFRWTSKFSIPFDATNGIVKASVVTPGDTTYYAKPLDKEVRLAKVDCATTAGGLATSTSSAPLPDATGWISPLTTVGTKPTVTAAPQVIHGVKQYD